MLATTQQNEVKLSELQQQQVAAAQLERDDALRNCQLLTEQLQRHRDAEQVSWRHPLL